MPAVASYLPGNLKDLQDGTGSSRFQTPGDSLCSPEAPPAFVQAAATDPEVAQWCGLESPKKPIPSSPGMPLSRNIIIFPPRAPRQTQVHREERIRWTVKYCNCLLMPFGMLLKEFWNKHETFWMLKHWMSQKIICVLQRNILENKAIGFEQHDVTLVFPPLIVSASLGVCF